MWSANKVYDWVAEHIDYSIYYDMPSAPDVRIRFNVPVERNGNSFTEIRVQRSNNSLAIDLHVGDQWRDIDMVNDIIAFNVFERLNNQQFKFVVL